MFSSADVAAVRHVVQRILVPCVFVIGLLGNSVSIYVLTRKRMRCTTNIYLTALAITDIIYLTMALMLSLKHYDYVQRNVEIFWKCYGYIMWLCDACAYISIYIAVCFTIERFIAIRYPLKRQTFCTESLAKKVITGVALFCLFSTISTAFEHQYRIAKKSIDIHGQACNVTQADTPERLSWLQLNYNESVRQQQQQQQQHHRREDNEPHLPLQHYMPLPKSPTTPHIDFEGSGQAAAAAAVAVSTDERTGHIEQHQHPHWHTRAAVDSTVTTGAVVNKKDNLINRGRNNEGDAGDGVGDGGELGHAWQPKPDVILRRLKRTVQAHTSTTTHTPSTSPTLLSLATPLPPVALTTDRRTRSTTAFGWSMQAAGTVATETAEAVATTSALQRGIRSVEQMKGGPLLKHILHTAAEANIPRVFTNFFSFDNRPDLLLDSEFLVSAATPLEGNDVETEQIADSHADGVEQQEQQFGDLLDIEGWSAEEEEVQDAETVFFNITEYCKEVTYYVNSPSELGENATYTRLWYFFTLFVFVLIPLLLLATFNCFLIMLVRRSKNLRGEMTNANSIRRSRMSGKGPRKTHSSSVSQENRITVTLIAVVLLFIICQLPWAIYLIVSENVDIDGNLQAIIGNIFNFLAALNAAANFFLYCVLSDKYRKTVRELITGYKYRGHARNTTATTSLYAQSLNGSRRYRPTAASIVVK